LGVGGWGGGVGGGGVCVRTRAEQRLYLGGQAPGVSRSSLVSRNKVSPEHLFQR